MFVGGEPVWANACVGDNGSPNYNEYSIGYSKAANILLDTACERGDMTLCDELVYPICFNMRHSVELRIKHALISIDELVQLTSKGKSHQLNLDKTHDLEKLWSRFKECSNSFDDRLFECNDAIDLFVQGIANIDSNGQVFRYPFGKQDEKHLLDVGGVINLFVLRENFKDLEHGLERLRVMVAYLNEEYDCGTYTKYLSRYQLFSISKKLLNKGLWREERFKNNKEKIRVEYGLSGKKLSRGIEKILGSYQLSSEIGVYPKLKGISIDVLKKTIEASLDYHPKVKTPLEQRGNRIISSLDSFDMGFYKENNKNNKLKEFCESIASPSVAAGVSAIFNLYKDGFFSEYYGERYSIELSGAVKQRANQNMEDIYHYLHKSNYIEGVLRSLVILNRRELVAELLHEFELLGCFHFEKDISKEPQPDIGSPYRFEVT